jgi:isopenicillin-N N-acyltransferase-like protein
MATGAFPHIRTRGQPFERGRQYGAQAGDPIRRFVDRLVDRARRSRPDLTRADVLRRTLAFEPLYEAFAPHLVEEIRGLAAGARISFAEALLCNVRGEVNGLIPPAPPRPETRGRADAETRRAPSRPIGDRRVPASDRLRVRGEAGWGDGCTAFAFGRSVTRHGDVLAGQNSDQGPDAIDVSVVLTVEPDDAPPLVIFTHAGEIGYHGMNGAGVAHFANAVPPAGPWRRAMPHYLMKRVLLEQARVEDCLALLRRARVASPANYVLADRSGRLLDVEMALDRVEVVEPRDDVVVHANHYEHPALTHLNAAASGLANWVGDTPLERSTCRSERLAALAGASRGRLDVELVKRALADHAGDRATICAHDASYMVTTASLIAELEHGRLHVSYGNPCQGSWTIYQLP